MISGTAGWMRGSAWNVPRCDVLRGGLVAKAVMRPHNEESQVE